MGLGFPLIDLGELLGEVGFPEGDVANPADPEDHLEFGPLGLGAVIRSAYQGRSSGEANHRWSFGTVPVPSADHRRPTPRRSFGFCQGCRSTIDPGGWAQQVSILTRSQPPGGKLPSSNRRWSSTGSSASSLCFETMAWCRIDVRNDHSTDLPDPGSGDHLSRTVTVWAPVLAVQTLTNTCS